MWLTGGKAGGSALQSLWWSKTQAVAWEIAGHLRKLTSHQGRSCLARSWESSSTTLLCPYLYQYSVLTLQRDSSGGHSGAVLSIKTSNLSLCCISNKPCISSLTTARKSFLKQDFGDWKWEHIFLIQQHQPNTQPLVHIQSSSNIT